MFNSTVLEVGIGILFCFTAVSLIVSSTNEMLASVLRLRSKTLFSGLRMLLNDSSNDGLVMALYNHASFNPLGNGNANDPTQLKHLPSYINAKTFASAMTDILQNAPNTRSNIEATIANLTDPQLRQIFIGLLQRANGDIEQFSGHLATWFNNGMERLSGIYKRKMQIITVATGFVVAALFNIDFFHLVKVLWEHPTLAQSLSADKVQDATQLANLLDKANILPVGWTQSPSAYHPWQWPVMCGGWLVTALSTLLGAPFWFEMLQKATNLRGTGPKK